MRYISAITYAEAAHTGIQAERLLRLIIPIRLRFIELHTLLFSSFFTLLFLSLRL